VVRTWGLNPFESDCPTILYQNLLGDTDVHYCFVGLVGSPSSLDISLISTSLCPFSFWVTNFLLISDHLPITINLEDDDPPSRYTMVVWQGWAMDSLKFHPRPPCPTFLRSADGPPLKQPYVSGLQLSSTPRQELSVSDTKY
jgi:hypothetical protein